ncbi:3-dehydroquinate synthase [Trueperella sp. LYQ143]|uniref:3-dehydroquinate synthase n=1 Tax=Trueperella sp. LYQ143 TaxID=3391059 RepID=UPI0039838152
MLAVIIGMPGAGKSTVGRHAAQNLGVEFADSDELIVKRYRRSVPQIFAELGESGFRRIEAETIAWACEHFSGILALGGGAVLHPDTRQMLAGQRVILIEATDEELIRRVSKSRTVRPLLKHNPAQAIRKLRRERSTIYHRVASHVVLSDAHPVAHVVDEVVKLLEKDVCRIEVGGPRPYDVIIGHNLLSYVVRQAAQYANTLVVYSEDLQEYARELSTELTIADIPHAQFRIPTGERCKTVDILAAGWHAAGQAGISRDGVIIAIGGGATTDLAGFIAATWLRGIAVIHVPTSLLAMVDAGIGGKTGINVEHGKNLVGAFHPPAAVICDVDTLSTLPEAELRAGMGEVVKCGFIADPVITEIVMRPDFTMRGPELMELIVRAVRVKAEVVSEDLHEQGRREILNYGHTLAHAIELSSHYTVRHGEAVAIGCVFAAELASAAGIAPPELTNMHREVIQRVGLPISYHGVSRHELLAIMHADKKVRKGQLRFVVLDDVAKPRIMTNPHRDLLDAAFAGVGL